MFAVHQPASIGDGSLAFHRLPFLPNVQIAYLTSRIRGYSGSRGSGAVERNGALFDLGRLAGSEGHAYCDLRQIDGASGFRVLCEFVRGRAGQLRTKMPEKRVPARLQKSHHAVADQKERTQPNQAPDYQIVIHQILSSVPEELSNASTFFRAARHC